jgi:hypothetical protein
MVFPSITEPEGSQITDSTPSWLMTLRQIADDAQGFDLIPGIDCQPALANVWSCASRKIQRLPVPLKMLQLAAQSPGKPTGIPACWFRRFRSSSMNQPHFAKYRNADFI